MRIIKVGPFGLGTNETRIGSTSDADIATCRGHVDPLTGRVVDPSPNRVWLNAGFQPAKVKAAWVHVSQGIAQLFPKQVLSADFIAKHQAFPPFNNAGEHLPQAESVYDPLTQGIIDEGKERFGRRFSMQWNAYGAASRLPQIHELVSMKGASNVAWQLNNLGGGHYTGCGHLNPCTPVEFEVILLDAVSNQASFVEVHAGNVSDRRYSWAFKRAQAALDGTSH